MQYWPFVTSVNMIVYILTECRMSSISNAHEMVFTATCAVSDFYANKGGFKIVFVITVQEVKLTLLTKSNGVVQVECKFVCNFNLFAFELRNTRIEDGREDPEDDVKTSLRRDLESINYIKLSCRL
ncbi:hypothetical protein T4C_13070 [Trichinella pseudospiralis]|uniref:Uncharacterized protein n=1 Tax=Trichinella pseudospiralis TaxID=6337 RepID=A0A0V1K0B1_TRIPS|nr:hypothetical protein T4C_13070 [Trichinella pseudospiralis]